MDLLSGLIGFLLGALSGAAGAYLGQKYTDKRRLKESISARNKDWTDLKRRFPAVLEEMIADLRNPAHEHIRIFFVKTSWTIVNTDEPTLEYNTDAHDDLHAALGFMEDLGYIEDITPGNCPKYRMKEHFVDLLRQG